MTKYHLADRLAVAVILIAIGAIAACLASSCTSDKAQASDVSRVISTDNLGKDNWGNRINRFETQDAICYTSQDHISCIKR